MKRLADVIDRSARWRPSPATGPCPSQQPNPCSNHSLFAGWRTAAHGGRRCIGYERTHLAKALGSRRNLLPASLGRHASRVGPTIPWSNRGLARRCNLSTGFRRPKQCLPSLQALVRDFTSALPCSLEGSPPRSLVAVLSKGDTRREAAQGEWGRRRSVLRPRFGDPGQYELRIISMREQQFRSDLARGILTGRTNRNCARGPRT